MMVVPTSTEGTGSVIARMTPGAQLHRLTLLAGCVLLAIAANADAQAPQISEAVRATMFMDKGDRSGARRDRYVVMRQPPIYDLLPPGASRSFDVDDDLLDYFLGLPAPLQSLGLWITRAGSPNDDIEEDRRRVEQLVGKAARKRLLLYVCDLASSDDAELIGWECRKQSPQKSEQRIFCSPRAQPQPRHPWWDCSIRTAHR